MKATPLAVAKLLKANGLRVSERIRSARVRGWVELTAGWVLKSENNRVYAVQWTSGSWSHGNEKNHTEQQVAAILNAAGIQSEAVESRCRPYDDDYEVVFKHVNVLSAN